MNKRTFKLSQKEKVFAFDMLTDLLSSVPFEEMSIRVIEGDILFVHHAQPSDDVNLQTANYCFRFDDGTKWPVETALSLCLLELWEARGCKR
jgi:hypothetical protein